MGPVAYSECRLGCAWRWSVRRSAGNIRNRRLGPLPGRAANECGRRAGTPRRPFLGRAAGPGVLSALPRTGALIGSGRYVRGLEGLISRANAQGTSGRLLARFLATARRVRATIPARHVVGLSVSRAAK